MSNIVVTKKILLSSLTKSLKIIGDKNDWSKEKYIELGKALAYAELLMRFINE